MAGRTRFRGSRSVTTGRFAVLYTLFTLVAFHGPVTLRSLALLEGAPAGEKVMSVAALLGAGAFLQILLLIGLSFLSVRLMKLVAMAELLVNAFAFYFIAIYGIALDDIIIRNVFATDTKTTLDLFHILIPVFVLVLGVVPATIVWRARVERETRLRRLGLAAITTVSFAGYMMAASFTWTWLDSNLKELGGKTLPWSYVFNTARYLSAEAKRNRVQTLLPDLVLPDLPPGQRDVVVLVIGEAARAENHTLYGYDRVTNPYTADLRMVALPDARSCATYTLAGLACILTHEGSNAAVATSWEPLPSYLHRFGVEVLWRTNNSGEPRVTVDEYEPRNDVLNQCAPDCPDPEYEDWLVWQIGERIARSDNPRMLVVLHQGNGSHGPAYSTQYPPEFQRFAPVCDTVRIRGCPPQTLINAYDNTIVYTDHLLARVIEQLDALENTRSVLIYVSDHGQSLGESGVYLHGMPNSVAPAEQRRIPILVWMSRAFRSAHGVTDASVTGGGAHGHDNIFHSVLGAFGGKSDIYRPEFDIFARQR